jgi:hypothetical protein
MRGDGANAGHDLRAASQRLELAGVLIGLHRGHRRLEATFAIGRRLVHVCLAEPVVRVRLVNVDHGVRKRALPILAEAAEVITVHMGDAHFVDLLWRVARRLQVREELPHGGPEQRARTGVDEHELRACVDQESVHRSLHRRLQMLLREERIHQPGRGVREQAGHVQIHRAIENGGDFEIPQRHAVEARRLRLQLWSRRARHLRTRHNRRRGQTQSPRTPPIPGSHIGRSSPKV